MSATDDARRAFSPSEMARLSDSPDPQERLEGAMRAGWAAAETMRCLADEIDCGQSDNREARLDDLAMLAEALDRVDRDTRDAFWRARVANTQGKIAECCGEQAISALLVALKLARKLVGMKAMPDSDLAGVLPKGKASTELARLREEVIAEYKSAKGDPKAREVCHAPGGAPAGGGGYPLSLHHAISRAMSLLDEVILALDRQTTASEVTTEGSPNSVDELAGLLVQVGLAPTAARLKADWKLNFDARFNLAMRQKWNSEDEAGRRALTKLFGDLTPKGDEETEFAMMRGGARHLADFCREIKRTLEDNAASGNEAPQAAAVTLAITKEENPPREPDFIFRRGGDVTAAGAEGDVLIAGGSVAVATPQAAAMPAAKRPARALKATVAARMIDLIRDSSRYTWTAAQFAEYLNCAPSAIVKTAAWKQLAVARESAKLEHSQRKYEQHQKSKPDRRRRPRKRVFRFGD